MLFFSRKNAIPLSLVLDIGSKSVGAGLFEKAPRSKPRLLYATWERIAFQETLTGENLLRAMLRSLDLAILHMERYGLHHLNSGGARLYHIRTAEVILSSPWYTAETKILKLLWQRGAPVTKSALESLFQTEEKTFEEKTATTAEYGEQHLVENKVLEVRLNGYPTAFPYGKVAFEAAVLVFVSLSPRSVVDKIRSMIRRRLSVEHVSFRTFALAAYASIRDMFPNDPDHLIIQIGGEITDLMVVKKGVIAETASFPAGQNSLMRSFMAICGGEPHCTLESLLHLHYEGRAETDDKKKVDKAVENAKGLWQSGFQEAMAGFSEEAFLPRTVFLFEEKSYAPIFEEYLRGVESGQFTVTEEPFTVISFDRNMGRLFGAGDSPVSDAVLQMEADFVSRF